MRLVPPCLFLCLSLLSVSWTAAGSHPAGFEYVSPTPGSSLNLQQTNIIVRPGGVIDQASVGNSGGISARGNRSGNHPGTTFLSDDGRTIVFNPTSSFLPGEKVTVTLPGGVRFSNGSPVSSVTFSFRVSNTRQASLPPLLPDEEMEGTSHPASPETLRPSGSSAGASVLDSLPLDFPPVALLQADNPTLGGIFLANIVFDTTIHTTTYLMVLDNSGHPLSYHRIGTPCHDFMLQPNGKFTYFSTSRRLFAETDTGYNEDGVYYAGNGYQTDPHELRVLPNGHVLFVALDRQYIRMDTIVPGGNPNALVTGNAIQELDRNRNVVFQWRSWDHFRIIDAVHENLTAATVDYDHMNAIDIDTDGNLLLSSRHLSEITKINRQTGEIIWRLGGVHNQFTFVNDTMGFSYQHAIRRISNGNITMFDNGNFHATPFSRALEYQLDETALTATLVWQYRHTPDIFGSAMGYVQRFDDGNTLIGWGATNPSVTEVRADGSEALELNLPPGVFSYRAIRFPWPPGVESVAENPAVPQSFRLDQNFPNPFNPSTTIRYELPGPEHVTLTVFNTLGQVVAQVVNQEEPAGDQSAVFDAEGLSSGMYFYRLEAGDFVQTKKLLLLK